MKEIHHNQNNQNVSNDREIASNATICKQHADVFITAPGCHCNQLYAFDYAMALLKQTELAYKLKSIILTVLYVEIVGR